MMIFREYSGREIRRMQDCKNPEWTMREIGADYVECYSETGDFTGIYSRDGDDIGFQQADFE